MERCSYCQAELLAGQPFCPQCGQRHFQRGANTRVLPPDILDAPTTPSGQPPVDAVAHTEPGALLWPPATPVTFWKPETPPADATHLLPTRLLALAMVGLIVIGTVGLAALLFIVQTSPAITVTSPYHADGHPAGSAATTLHIQGQHFADNSAIVFSLDGQPIRERQGIRSNQQGAIEASLEIGADWPLGTHTLTASDATRNGTPTGVPVVIVSQGEANTPGPYGAPADDTSFAFTAALLNEGSFNHRPYYFQLDLMIRGQPDPKGGKVCASRDTGQPQSFTGNIYDPATGAPGGLTYHEFITFTCSGQYKGGQLKYIEHATSDKLTLSNGVSCVGQTPYVFRSLQGAFSDPIHITGIWTSDPIMYRCASGFTLIGPSAQENTWSGQL